MSDDYLWDGSGKPDPEVQRLELLLRRFGQAEAATPIPFPERTDAGSPDSAEAAMDHLKERAVEGKARIILPFGPPRSVRSGRARWFLRAGPAALLASAATLLLALAAVYLAQRRPSPGWEVVRLAGSPQVASARIATSGSLPVGGWLETDAASRAEIRIGLIGKAEVGPNTRVRLVAADRTEHRLELERGTLSARIWAPPRLFYVETPSATVVDLGCAYTLSVDDHGAGILKVTSGWVAFDLRGRESFVPAGALCETRNGIGPGTPFFEDAPATLRKALEELDFGSARTASGERALSVILDSSRRRDALTLWHLLTRLDGAERARVYERMADLVAPPPGVTRAGVLSGDRHMTDLWWDELGLGVSTWWRLWKSPGPPS